MSTSFTASNGTTNYNFGAEDTGGGILVSRTKELVGPDGVGLNNWATARLISANSTNATAVEASPAAVGFIYAVNLNAAVRFLKLYNKATVPVVGTDVPVATLPIPASTTGAGFMIPIPGGAAFSAGIGLALTTGIGDADATAVAANEIVIWIGYA